MVGNLDDPETTDRIHRQILARKPFLRDLYRETYLTFRDLLPEHRRAGKIVELGSGGGFLKEIVPGAITSDVMPISKIDLRMSGTALPFKTASVDAFFLLDTFHHIPDAGGFLKEVDRSLKPGGLAVMMEPANTLWGRFIYRNFHHEPFEPKAGWDFNSTGPLSSANGALPWIVFSRDRARFEKDFPRLRLRTMEPNMPVRYLLSGGFSKPQLTPSFTFPFWRLVERMLKPLFPWIGMFYWIVLEKNAENVTASQS